MPLFQEPPILVYIDSVVLGFYMPLSHGIYTDSNAVHNVSIMPIPFPQTYSHTMNCRNGTYHISNNYSHPPNMKYPEDMGEKYGIYSCLGSGPKGFSILGREGISVQIWDDEGIHIDVNNTHLILTAFSPTRSLISLEIQNQDGLMMSEVSSQILGRKRDYEQHPILGLHHTLIYSFIRYGP